MTGQHRVHPAISCLLHAHTQLRGESGAVTLRYSIHRWPLRRARHKAMPAAQIHRPARARSRAPTLALGPCGTTPPSSSAPGAHCAPYLPSIPREPPDV
ncbi:hypothetical protein FIBSPDRAFT_847993 [Athelia psychrophila]|uniref:Uncharacterized protein n=1 Tax=Athelia psychrophila TaxID=1759441 RepID=A0A166W428_9AGAM|nr:hypothetical protein FIBSPDRAFT_847989 [Fibularhizoctonia sp. CBS 109695]KZP33350.1 hypothetical protein FIBSPDRAFT_847993 [Fibularhizoctonia sp. CBS 109695]